MHECNGNYWQELFLICDTFMQCDVYVAGALVLVVRAAHLTDVRGLGVVVLLLVLLQPH